jgi:hypothetical protein
MIHLAVAAVGLCRATLEVYGSGRGSGQQFEERLVSQLMKPETPVLS